MNYNSIIGHHVAIESLKRSVDNGSESHFYIFDGDDGLGKRTIGEIFAKTLLCKEKMNEPCQICSSCRKFDSGNHPDFKEIFPEKGLIKKGVIDEVIRSMAMAPFESEKKVLIIDQAHTMNKEGQNAFLKTLEEPPGFIHIIFVSSSTKNLLQTIRSRGQIVRFYPIPKEEVTKYLVENENVEPDVAGFLSEFTKGSIGKAIELSKSETFFQTREWIIELIDSLVKGEKWKVFSTIDRFSENKEGIQDVLEIFLFWFRDLILFKTIPDSTLIINSDKKILLREQSFLDFDKINDIIEKIVKTMEDVQTNVNFQLSIETMLFKIQEEF
ncbi:MAG: DNA polymerase III subunit delta' [Clostridia bacterium]|nr:DNA polymerase III subunit delta' [Clostridia bacterium]